MPHNVSIQGATRTAATGSRRVNADGGQNATYHPPPLAPGDYPFYCSVHPNMTGTLHGPVGEERLMATTTLAPRAGAYTGRRSWIYEWLTTTDHKKIGVMYIITAFSFFLAGRHLRAAHPHASWPCPGLQFLDPETYNQLFGMHAHRR